MIILLECVGEKWVRKTNVPLVMMMTIDGGLIDGIVAFFHHFIQKTQLETNLTILKILDFRPLHFLKVIQKTLKSIPFLLIVAMSRLPYKMHKKLSLLTFLLILSPFFHQI